MIDELFVNFLKEETNQEKHSQIDLGDILNLLEKENISVKTHNKGGFVGLSTFWGIYFNLNNLSRFPNAMKYFIILHEIGHMKRIRKRGQDDVLSSFSESDFDKFAESVINEEIIADRYALFVYRKLSGCFLSKDYTQKLDLPEYQKRYKSFLKPYHTNLDNSLESYKKDLKNKFDINV